MNKIAILIIAHKNEEQLRLLLRSLVSDFDVFVHVDTHSNINISNLKQEFKSCIFLSKYHVIWGGITLTKCSLYLFQESYKYKYEHYILISGQDLPIKSNEQIKLFLEENKTSFVVSDKLPLPQWKFHGGIDRVTLYWEFDVTGNSLWSNLKRRIIGNIRKHQRLRNIKRPFYKNMDLYGGSNWVILRKDALEYLINFTENNPGYMRRLKYCSCTDELWMQTILATSDCKTKSEHFTFLNWSKGPEYPRTLRMEDYEDIKKSSCIFARKFDLDVDSDIVYKILEDRKK